ncbi:MAG: glycoside hydrolase family 15 protein [Chloroflexi bacterium]|nr:glycoside hydrolase family 15 protein [Chloroflexota bacterium]
MSYQPIEDYGIIGNMRTAALVGRDGSIDWLCWPEFDSPSIFASILDRARGGRFAITPVADNVVNKQFYWPDTNVLITRFLSADGVGEVRDYMPVGPLSQQRGFHGLLRQVTVVRGSMQFRMECSPAFDYARIDPTTEMTGQGARFHSPNLSLVLSTSVPLRREGKGVAATFALSDGQQAGFVLDAGDGACSCPTDEELGELFRDTADYWRRWLSQCTYRGRWREAVNRSALALKLPTHQPTGAIVAAPTASLPETLGGERNWDYRYSWIRDAAFTLYGFLRIGFTEEAAAFMQWLGRCSREVGPAGPLQVMYRIDGSAPHDEQVLLHLEGYRGSRPVRIGNGAYVQLQLDIYGALMDAVYLYNKYGTPVSYDLWVYLRQLMDWLCDHWHEEDEGIWEVRAGRQQLVYSKVMCWVALDRALRLADRRSFPADRDRWLRTRDQIYEDVMAKGWSASQKAFVQSYTSPYLDAATLIMPLVFFLAPTDPRMLDTLRAINRRPSDGGLVSDSLVYRYDVSRASDGLTGQEGTFNMCMFWLVEAMVRAGRDDASWLNEALVVFEQMLGYANHLGLYAEETGPNGEALGNFPQAFTHLALISSAFNLDRALGRGT